MLRHRASLAWRMNAGDGRALVLASLLAEDESAEEIARLFNGEGHAPPALSDAEHARAWLRRRQESRPPMSAASIRFGSSRSCCGRSERILPDEMRAMNARASVDLRVNTLRAAARRHAGRTALARRGRGGDAVFARRASASPRARASARLQHTQFFQTGAFEFQDEASQLVTQLCAVKPGESVLDLAAGAGGKSLALAALMHNRGEILAFDVDARAAEAASAPRAPGRRHDHQGRRPARRTGMGQRQVRCRAGRCAVQRFGHVAPQPGAEMAAHARAPERAQPRCRPG